MRFVFMTLFVCVTVFFSNNSISHPPIVENWVGGGGPMIWFSGPNLETEHIQFWNSETDDFFGIFPGGHSSTASHSYVQRTESRTTYGSGSKNRRDESAQGYARVEAKTLSPLTVSTKNSALGGKPFSQVLIPDGK